jgi:hypothetical protein
MTSVISAGIRPRLQLPAEQTVVVTLMSFPLIGLLLMVKANGEKKVSLTIVTVRMGLDVPL